MNYFTKISVTAICNALLCLYTSDACAADPPAFKSELFKTGTLVYSDDFDGKINRERWGAPTKDKQIADGRLIVSQKFKSKEEAIKALIRAAVAAAGPMDAATLPSRVKARLKGQATGDLDVDGYIQELMAEIKRKG